MMSSTITTAIATPPMFFTISVSVKWSAPEASGLAAASCSNSKRPKTFVPKRLVRIVTVNPSKIGCFRLIASREAGTAYGNRGDTTLAPQLLSHEVVLDHSGNFHWLPRKLGWGESRLTRSAHSYCLQERMP